MNNLFKFRLRFFALIAIFLVSVSSAFAQQKIAIIDAGSSGSRLYVYEISADLGKTTCLYPKTKEEEKGSKWRALSTIPAHQDSVKVFLDSMTMKYASTSTSQIDLYVLATAGMRCDNMKDKASNIYGFMTDYTIKGYKIKGAMTISGRYEGLYAWIAANYDKGTLGYGISAPQKTLTFTKTPYGIIEIGGASLQITFAKSPDSSSDFSKDCISRKGFSNIYSKSYLGGGLNEFMNKSKKDSKSNMDDVLEGLRTIKKLCDNIAFIGIGWAFNGLSNDTDAKNKQKQTYVTDIRNTIGLTNMESINTSWTLGAALDIVLNKAEPEAFDYVTQN